MDSVMEREWGGFCVVMAVTMMRMRVTMRKEDDEEEDEEDEEEEGDNY
jgi:hypothetical protein